VGRNSVTIGRGGKGQGEVGRDRERWEEAG